MPSVFPLHISQSITLQAMAQQVVEVHVSIPNTPDILPMLAESNVLAHSQILEPDVQWEHLSVFFQYISISPELTSQVLIVNNLDYMVTYDRNAVIGHIELLNMVASKEEIQNDPLASVLLAYLEDMDNVSINPSEERICIDIPEDHILDLTEINCHSSDPSHVNWLQALHTKYSSIFSSAEFDPGNKKGSSIHLVCKLMQPYYINDTLELIQKFWTGLERLLQLC